jgi:uncharacterized protein
VAGNEAITVVDNPERHRYEISVAGEPAGFAAYRLTHTEIVLTHTEIDDRFEGLGLGSRLARAVLDAERVRGLPVVPRCPFIAGWIEHHPDYADLLLPER